MKAALVAPTEDLPCGKDDWGTPQADYPHWRWTMVEGMATMEGPSAAARPGKASGAAAPGPHRWIIDDLA